MTERHKFSERTKNFFYRRNSEVQEFFMWGRCLRVVRSVKPVRSLERTKMGIKKARAVGTGLVCWLCSNQSILITR